MTEENKTDEQTGQTEQQDSISHTIKLTTEELAIFHPKCAYCGMEIDAERMRRRKRTCCDEHTKLYAQYKRYQQSMIRCPSCYRPSTPEQRKDFKAWRKSRGELLQAAFKGRPSKTREKQMELQINEFISSLLEKSIANVGQSVSISILEVTETLEKILHPPQQV